MIVPTENYTKIIAAPPVGITQDRLLSFTEAALSDGKAVLATIDDVSALVRSRGITQAVAKSVRAIVEDREQRLEAQNNLAELRLRMERRIGEILQALPMQNGARPADAGYSDSTPSLDDMGVNKNQSSAWQLIAQLPIDIFEATCADAKESGWELSTRDMTSRARHYLNLGTPERLIIFYQNVYLQNDGSLIMPSSLYKELETLKNRPVKVTITLSETD